MLQSTSNSLRVILFIIMYKWPYVQWMELVVTRLRFFQWSRVFLQTRVIPQVANLWQSLVTDSIAIIFRLLSMEFLVKLNPIQILNSLAKPVKTKIHPKILITQELKVLREASSKVQALFPTPHFKHQHPQDSRYSLVWSSPEMTTTATQETF